MIKNHVLITWRSMMKNKALLLVNVLGLAVGIGCCIVAFFNWEFDSSYDYNHANRRQIYRVSSIREFEGRSTLYGFAPLPMGAAIRQNIPDIEKLTRLSLSNSNLIMRFIDNSVNAVAIFMKTVKAIFEPDDVVKD